MGREKGEVLYSSPEILIILEAASGEHQIFEVNDCLVKIGVLWDLILA